MILRITPLIAKFFRADVEIATFVLNNYFCHAHSAFCDDKVYRQPCSHIAATNYFVTKYFVTRSRG